MKSNNEGWSCGKSKRIRMFIHAEISGFAIGVVFCDRVFFSSVISGNSSNKRSATAWAREDEGRDRNNDQLQADIQREQAWVSAL